MNHPNPNATPFSKRQLEAMGVEQLQHLIFDVHGFKYVYPKGVFKFKTFEDQEKWDKEILINFCLSHQLSALPQQK